MFQNRPSMRRFVACTDSNVPELSEEEQIEYQLEQVKLCFDVSKGPVGVGKLFITTLRLIWLSDKDDKAFDFDARYIVLHAISRDTNSYPEPALYCQLDVEDYDEADGDEADEMYLVPEKEDDLTPLFDAMSHLALINPDPPEEGEQEGDDELIYNIDEVTLGAQQANALAHLESVFVAPNEVHDSISENANAQQQDNVN